MESAHSLMLLPWKFVWVQYASSLQHSPLEQPRFAFHQGKKNEYAQKTTNVPASKNVFVGAASSNLVKVAPRVLKEKFVEVNGVLEVVPPIRIVLRKNAVFPEVVRRVAMGMAIVIMANVAIRWMMFASPRNAEEEVRAAQAPIAKLSQKLENFASLHIWVKKM